MSTTPGEHYAGPAIGRVLACLDDTDYLQLPEELDGDLGFLDRAKVASCVSAMSAVVRRARRQGIEVRPSSGIIVLPPFAGLHCWAEFRVEGRWVGFDPHLVRYLEESRVLPVGAWPRLRSLSGLLLRLGESPVSLVTHGGLHAEVSFAVRRTA